MPRLSNDELEILVRELERAQAQHPTLYGRKALETLRRAQAWRATLAGQHVTTAMRLERWKKELGED